MCCDRAVCDLLINDACSVNILIMFRTSTFQKFNVILSLAVTTLRDQS